MADLDRRYAQGTTVGRTEAGVVDQGLRAYMLRVYNYMASGVAITGVVAYAIYYLAGGDNIQVVNGSITGLTPFGSFMFASAFKWVVIFAPLALVFFISARINSMSLSAAQLSFWAFAALMGASIASIFLVYAGESIARMFFITAAAFGALSLWGYTTSKDLSGWGSFLFMGLIGIIIASLVNLFIGSTALQFAVSVIGVLVFAGLTAYDTQQIKEMYYVGDDGTVAGRKAVMGALRLYLDFINLFMMLLQLFGDRR
jgi:FtsH-binding integral membrane protein